MPAGLYFVLRYFSFTSGIHPTYTDIHLQRHNLFAPFGDVITEFDCNL